MTTHNTEELAASYKRTKSPALRDTIVAINAGMVERIARRFVGSSEPIEDLTQEGFIGLLNALELYDPNKGVKFTTWATHLIVGQIKHHLRDKGKIIKEPAWLQELNQRITRVSSDLLHALGRQPTTAELAQALELTEEKLTEVLASREVFRVASVDAVTEQENGERTFDIDKLESAEAPPFQFSLEDRVVLESAIRQLRDIEQRVIESFFYEGLNQTEIAHQQNISCNYVSHILRHSVQKLRRILTTEDLKDRQMQQRRTGSGQPSAIDEQTGVYSAAYLRIRLEEELQRAKQANVPLSLVMIRITGLEGLRAFYGDMTIGDFLREAATLVKGVIRRSDILTRCGDWEFAVILPRTGRRCEAVRERLSASLDEWKSRLFEANSNPVNISCSTVTHPDIGSSVKAILQAARDRLEDNDKELAA